jgi:preprotein translocase subunit SecG
MTILIVVIVVVFVLWLIGAVIVAGSKHRQP